MERREFDFMADLYEQFNPSEKRFRLATGIDVTSPAPGFRSSLAFTITRRFQRGSFKKNDQKSPARARAAWNGRERVKVSAGRACSTIESCPRSRLHKCH